MVEVHVSEKIISDADMSSDDEKERDQERKDEDMMYGYEDMIKKFTDSMENRFSYTRACKLANRNVRTWFYEHLSENGQPPSTAMLRAKYKLLKSDAQQQIDRDDRCDDVWHVTRVFSGAFLAVATFGATVITWSNFLSQ